jgi:hypothetical protein
MAAKPPISPAAIGGLARVLFGGGLVVYGATNSLFNVEGGHRAIVFNRLVGIKEEVRRAVLRVWGFTDVLGTQDCCACGARRPGCGAVWGATVQLRQQQQLLWSRRARAMQRKQQQQQQHG